MSSRSFPHYWPHLHHAFSFRSLHPITVLRWWHVRGCELAMHAVHPLPLQSCFMVMEVKQCAWLLFGPMNPPNIEAQVLKVSGGWMPIPSTPILNVLHCKQCKASKGTCCAPPSQGCDADFISRQELIDQWRASFRNRRELLAVSFAEVRGGEGWERWDCMDMNLCAQAFSATLYCSPIEMQDMLPLGCPPLTTNLAM